MKTDFPIDPSHPAAAGQSPALEPVFALPADGLYHLVPQGRFPHAEAGVIQVLDEPACRAIARRFAEEARQPGFAGLLVDFDHFSHDPAKPSEAAGWITRLEARAGGVWGEIRWSDKGERAVKGGRYRFVSPVFDAADLEEVAPAPGARDVPGSVPPLAQPRSPSAPRALRPRRLARLALTNDPNLKGMQPLTNRAAAPVAARPPCPDPSSGAAEGSIPNTHLQTPSMNKIATLLGLAAEADENALLARVEQLKNRVAELEQANRTLLEAEFDTRFAHRVKPEARPRVKEQFLANRAGTLLILEGLADPPHPNPAAPPPDGSAFDRHHARHPGAPLAQTQPRELRNREVEAFRQAHRCDYDTAWNAVRAAKPELFPD